MMGHNSDITREKLVLAINQSAYVIKATARKAGPSEDRDDGKNIV